MKIVLPSEKHIAEAEGFLKKAHDGLLDAASADAYIRTRIIETLSALSVGLGVMEEMGASEEDVLAAYDCFREDIIGGLNAIRGDISMWFKGEE